MTYAPNLVVISFYDRRTTEHLARALHALATVPAGAPFHVAVVVNRTGDRPFELPASPLRPAVIYRENLGMNIGAWDHGWRSFPGHDTCLFLQDECFAVREGWLAAFLQRLRDAEVGLVGEAVNQSWSHPWAKLAALHAGSVLPDHLIEGRASPRVDVYLDCMRRWGVDPGPTGAHLRSLVWAARRDTLERMGGFPIGLNYGECIAAEIAVSRKIAALGLRFVQVEAEPFTYFRHIEWNRTTPAAPFVHTADPIAASQAPSARDLADVEATVSAASAPYEDMLAHARRLGAGEREIVLAGLWLKLEERERRIAGLKHELAALQGAASQQPAARAAQERTDTGAPGIPAAASERIAGAAAAVDEALADLARAVHRIESTLAA